MTCGSLSVFPDAARFRRDPAQVMQLSRLGLGHPTRLSFLRTLLRTMQKDQWRFDRSVFDLDNDGFGRAV